MPVVRYFQKEILLRYYTSFKNFTWKILIFLHIGIFTIQTLEVENSYWLQKIDWEFLKYQVFMDVPLQVCEMRDPKGLYNLARAGKIKGNFNSKTDNCVRVWKPIFADDIKCRLLKISQDSICRPEYSFAMIYFMHLLLFFFFFYSFCVRVQEWKCI